jgi:hypothetical protein
MIGAAPRGRSGGVKARPVSHSTPHQVFIPDSVLRRRRMTPEAKLAYGLVLRYAMEGRAFLPEDVARDLGTTIPEARACLNQVNAVAAYA